MISTPKIDPIMPENRASDEPSNNDTVGSLTYWNASIEAYKSTRELLALLDTNLQIPGVLVLEKEKLVGMIPRENVYEKLGRPFGVELYLKQSIKKFYELLGKTTLVLYSNTTINNAVKMALMRDDQTLYDPIVISHPAGYRVISMYSLLMAQQDKLQELFSEVHDLSTKDPLTFINNRRGFFDAVNGLMVTIRNKDLEYAVLMIDIDNFKVVNDRYGHLVGDEVIKSVVHRICSLLREKDVVGRFGGDEFVVLLVDISKEAAFDLADKLRQGIASMFHPVNGFRIRVTISIGISHAKGTSNTLDRLLTEADQAVYASKTIGRNKVMPWSEKLSQSTKGQRIVRVVRNESTDRTEQTREQTLQGLLRMLYLRDYETEAHTQRVSELALDLARRVGVPETDFEKIRIGALLHDIGKIAIPDNILFKPGSLAEAEKSIMQKHPLYARDLLSSMPYFQTVLDIPYCHHEHWDGSGYPRGLRGEEIPMAARIFAIVDVWDALSSDRPYRAAWDEIKVKDYLLEQSGKLFDPTLVPLFLEILNSAANQDQEGTSP
ncbi:MAG TPA: diguanylate cyclase [Longilinea sp.]|nr:diguanylate cyclase [Longilinea sp.]